MGFNVVGDNYGHKQQHKVLKSQYSNTSDSDQQSYATFTVLRTQKNVTDIWPGLNQQFLGLKASGQPTEPPMPAVQR